MCVLCGQNTFIAVKNLLYTEVENYLIIKTMDKNHRICSECETEFKVKKVYSENKAIVSFCPFCGSELEDQYEVDELEDEYDE